MVLHLQIIGVPSIPTEVFIDSHGKIGHVQLGGYSNEDAKRSSKGYNKKKYIFYYCTRSGIGISRALQPTMSSNSSEAPSASTATVSTSRANGHFRQLDVDLLFAVCQPWFEVEDNLIDTSVRTIFT